MKTAGVYKMYPGDLDPGRHIFGEGQVNLQFVGQVKLHLRRTLENEGK